MKIAEAHIGKKMPHKRKENSDNVVTISLGGSDALESRNREFVFRSSAMQHIYTIARQVAGSDASILVFGESGTGKELFARLIHTLSDRSAYPFIPVNCGVLQGELFADKFFGHDSGAFTGANKQRKGAFELASTGTLFLDEVGEIPLLNQTDFLRVLEEKCYKRVGGEKELPFQARIVAATNRSLDAMVQEGTFRADLFYRLNVVPVYLPALRERETDIELLVSHLFSLFCHQYHRQNLYIDEEVLGFFESYHWPGNVRELRNLIERLVLLAAGPAITMADVPLDMLREASRHTGTRVESEVKAEPTSFTLAAAVAEAEIRAILRAFKHANGHKGRTAEVLGISSRSLRYKMAEYNLEL